MHKVYVYSVLSQRDYPLEKIKRISELTGIPLKKALLTSDMMIPFQKFVEGSKDHEKFINALREVGIIAEPTTIQTKWSEKDYQNASLLLLTPGEEIEVFSRNIDYDKIYSDDDACHNCGSGFKQVAPLIIDERKVRIAPSIFWTENRDIIINDKLRKILEDHKVSGIEFMEVIDYRSGEKIKRRSQLLVNNTLPMMKWDPDVLSGKKERDDFASRKAQCEVCGSVTAPRYTYFEYDKDVIERAAVCDMNGSYEMPLFGNPLFMKRKIIVTPRIYNIFVEHKMDKYVDFWVIPVT